jgi:rhamnosyl/mannosyltransferase
MLSIGRLTYYKGHEYLLRAVAKTPAVKLLIVGTGDLEEALANTVRELGISERVQMLGYVDDDQVIGLLATCDCLCLPSIERTEAFGLVMVEAMRYGKPVLATRIPGSGVGWVVEDRRTGLLVPPADEDALVSAIEDLRQDANLRQRFGTNAAESFRNRFHITPVAASIMEIYRKVLAESSPRESLSRPGRNETSS